MSEDTEASYEARRIKLETMMNQQYLMQRDTYGLDYVAMSSEEKIANFKEMKLALESELQEALDEMGWKPWATSRHFNKLAVQGELVDGWHFFMNLMLIADMTPLDLYEGYQRKRKKNIARQNTVEGYDGITGKCPRCKRALDDDAVDCHTYGYDGGKVNSYCCHKDSPEGEVIYV